MTNRTQLQPYQSSDPDGSVAIEQVVKSSAQTLPGELSIPERVQNQNSQVSKEGHPNGQIDHSQSCANDRTVREPRAMLEGFLIGQPHPAQRPPPLVLNRANIQIGAEHEPAYQEREGSDHRQRRAIGYSKGDSDNRRQAPEGNFVMGSA